MTFDPREYEARQNEAARAAAERLRPLVELDDWGAGPAVEFECPKGHSLRRYRVEERDATLVLVPIPGESAKRGPVATNGSPWKRGKTPCAEPGCGVLISSARGGTCELHGDRAEEQVHNVRTRFTCPSCKWSDNFTHARLLQVYGAAVHLGIRRVPVTFAPRRSVR